MNIVEIMLTTIKAKLMPVLNKLKLLTNKSFIKNKLLVRIRNFFYKLFDVRPKSEEDYYSFLGWMISKRLAMAVVIIISVLCIGFLWGSKPNNLKSERPYKSYKYNSIPLKFTTGKVEILGRSRYTAYIGDVEKGIVKGKGSLYNPQGKLVYEGDFDANAYNGTGKLYYANSQIAYEGEFKDNLYDGTGKLYRENGTLKYEGDFHQGQMEGKGNLYNVSQEKVYEGTFQKNQIVYEELIGKDTSEVAQMYTGTREIYTGEDLYSVYMKDIAAIYFGNDRSNTLEEEFQVNGLYILNSSILIDGVQLNEIPQLQDVFGNPIYEGNTRLEKNDELALNKACELFGEGVLYGKADYKETSIYDDVTELSDFDKEYQVYIYVYEKDDIIYTFFCKDKNQSFDFYMMEQ